MYAFLLTAAPKDESHYSFYTYRGKNPVTVTFRGHEYSVAKGTRFGVRPSSNQKLIRMIFPENKNRVFTLDLDTANRLANGVGRA